MNREIDIHQYEIGKKIGRGNFAEVYLVKDKNNQKTYAAKRNQIELLDKDFCLQLI